MVFLVCNPCHFIWLIYTFSGRQWQKFTCVLMKRKGGRPALFCWFRSSGITSRFLSYPTYFLSDFQIVVTPHISSSLFIPVDLLTLKKKITKSVQNTKQDKPHKLVWVLGITLINLLFDLLFLNLGDMEKPWNYNLRTCFLSMGL